MSVVAHRNPSAREILASLVVLFRDARQYDAKPLNAAYAASIMRLGIRIAVEERRASQETQAKPSARKRPSAPGSSA
jgi:hypothetical protein